jgi:predicted nuclease of predicted toxin-antitoxin system
LRFLIDAQLPPRLKQRLETAGHVAFHVFDELAADASDRAVAAKAVELDAALITKDDDFVELSRRGVLGVPLVWLRSGNMTSDRLWFQLEPLLPSIALAIDSGEMIVEVR